MVGFEARSRVADRGRSSRGCGGRILFVQADHFPSRDLFHVEQKGEASMMAKLAGVKAAVYEPQRNTLTG